VTDLAGNWQKSCVKRRAAGRGARFSRRREGKEWKRRSSLRRPIEFCAPRQLRPRIPYPAPAAIHGGIFGQIVVMRLFRDFGFLTQICGNNFMVLEVAPPPVVSDEQLDAFGAAVHDVVKLAHSPDAFWGEALGLARRALGA
jgi:ornithine--oxo-acid transaminase